MFNQTMLDLGKKRSCIRGLFEYGLRQAQVVGKENVYEEDSTCVMRRISVNCIRSHYLVGKQDHWQ